MAPFTVGALLAGAIAATIGALAAAIFDRLRAVYFVFFLPLLDLGVIQNPSPGRTGRHPGPPAAPCASSSTPPAMLLVRLAWLVAMITATVLLLGRSSAGRLRGS